MAQTVNEEMPVVSDMKSTPRCDQGRKGTGSRRSLPDGKWRGVFDMAHSRQLCI